MPVCMLSPLPMLLCVTVVVCGRMCFHAEVDEPKFSIPESKSIQSWVAGFQVPLADTTRLCLVSHTTQQLTTHSNKPRQQANASHP